MALVLFSFETVLCQTECRYHKFHLRLLDFSISSNSVLREICQIRAAKQCLSILKRIGVLCKDGWVPYTT